MLFPPFSSTLRFWQEFLFFFCTKDLSNHWKTVLFVASVWFNAEERYYSRILQDSFTQDSNHKGLAREDDDYYIYLDVIVARA